MRVKELVIDGFKSYQQRTIISKWDEQFNAITGLNGSGKSNILDAICFVLGITNTSHLRAANLQDLIYKKGQAGITKASVSINFDNSDRSKAPLNFEQYNEIVITRQISMNGPSVTSKYTINGSKSTQKEVALLLQSVQLNINNPNFLIMQGQITKMLNMKPKQILNLIEEASGTKMYEIQREQSEKIMAKKQKKMDSIVNTLKNQVEPKMVKLEKQKNIILEHGNMLSEKEQIEKIIIAYLYQNAIEQIEKLEKPLNDSKAKEIDLSQKLKTYDEQLAALISQIDELRGQQKQVDTSESKKLEIEEQSLADEVARLTTTKELTENTLNETQLSIKNKKIQLEKLQNDVNNIQANFKNYELEFLKEEENFKGFKELFQRKEDLYSTLSTGFSLNGATDAGYESQLRDLKQKVMTISTEMDQKTMKINYLKSQSDPVKLDACKIEIKKIEQKIDHTKQKIETLTQNLRDSGFDQIVYDQLRKDERNLSDEINKKSQRLNQYKSHDRRFDFTYQRPSDQFNDESVLGFCGELFELAHDKAKVATALEICAGGKLFNVVVDNDNTGKDLLNRGRLIKRTTFIPLNKITSRVINQQVVQTAKKLAPDKVDLALDLIEYTGDVKKAMEYTFGGKFICADAKTAHDVTFNNSIRTPSITLEGDEYDPQGRLSGGSRKQSSSLIAKFQEYRRLKKDFNETKQKLQDISNRLRKMHVVAQNNSGTQQQLNKEKYSLESLERALMGSNNSVYIAKYEQNMKEIEQLSNLAVIDQEKINQLDIEIKKIQHDMKEFNNNGAGKIKELKNEIANLKAEMKLKEKVLVEKRKKFQSVEIQNEETDADIKKLKLEIKEAEEKLPNLHSEIGQYNNQITDLDIKRKEFFDLINEEKRRNAGMADEIEALKIHLDKTKEMAASDKENVIDLRGRIKSMSSALKEYTIVIQSAPEFIRNDEVRAEVLTDNRNVDIQKLEARVAQYEERIQDLRSKGASQDILPEIQDLETQDKSLRNKIAQIEKDKAHIQETVEKLNGHLRTELENTYKKVSKDFGEIFNVLLPGSSAKLVKVKDNDVTAGLEIKVQLGSVWKESLVELSGGQRSLVAISLIMSLLQFRPAPMYILDEIDAALDLSHTQNIGHLIKTRFKGSQFIVVSLKQGMFENANRLYNVKFQDGTSNVTFR
ncbi:condensin subunit [Martiniozyma asiatica (nom. inval.)]|nr:condensin subunit [Martiniozyma asiatica]